MFYDFMCENCRSMVEIESSVADRDLPRDCPKCVNADGPGVLIRVPYNTQINVNMQSFRYSERMTQLRNETKPWTDKEVYAEEEKFKKEKPTGI